MFGAGTIFVIKKEHQFGENYRFVKVTRIARRRAYVSPLRYNPYEKLSETQFRVTPSGVTTGIEYRVDKDCKGLYIGNDGRMTKSYLTEQFDQKKDYVNSFKTN